MRLLVVTAQAQGTPSLDILLRHIPPNCSSPLIVPRRCIVAEDRLGEASRSLLGAGAPPYIPSRGNMLG